MAPIQSTDNASVESQTPLPTSESQNKTAGAGNKGMGSLPRLEAKSYKRYPKTHSSELTPR